MAAATFWSSIFRILRFIRTDTSAFDDYATRVMGQAFDTACAELQDNNLSDLLVASVGGVLACFRA